MLKRNFFRALLLPVVVLAYSISYSNDGAFRGSGNHLIPMYESDISVKKEILTIKRIDGDIVAITGYYEFFNPKADKELEVGFEAASPVGDVDGHPVNGQHPYMSQFTVNLNGESIPFKVAIVSDSVYYSNGKYKSKTIVQANEESDENSNYVDFFYVYHFKAKFKQGVNIIIHTYMLDLSNSVSENYSLIYILTAAKRWANRQIDDFTLQLDMGDLQDICIQNNFFLKASEWQIQGTGKGIDLKKNQKYGNEKNLSEFFIRKGMLVFQKLNFKPKDELYIQSFRLIQGNMDEDHFDYKHDELPFSIEDQENITNPANDVSKQILKNLPFARRGYVFKSTELQSYFERQVWYIKDESYKPVLTELTPKEQSWVIKW